MKIQLRLYIFLLLFFINIALSYSQSLHIINIDDCDYPKIAVTFELDKQAVCDFTKLKVIENDNFCKFKQDYYFEQEQKQLIAFLIDESLFSNSKSHSIINSIQASLCNAKYPKLVNTLIISKDTSDFGFEPISIEFTDSCKDLTKKCESVVLSSILYKKGIDKLFNYIKKYNAGSINLVLLSSTNLSNNYFKEIQKYADSLSIKCKNISFNQETKSQLANTKILTKQIRLAISENSYIDLNNSIHQYKIYFRTEQKAKLNFFEIHYKDNRTKGSFTHNNSNRISQNEIPFDYISLVLFIIIIVLLYFMIYKKQRKKVLNQSELSPVANTFNTKDTNYGSIKPYLTVLINDETEKFELKRLRTTIGRGNDNDLLIAHLTISNHHATITNEGGVFYIEDNDSTNGVLVNDIKITKQSIKTTDVIRLGKATLRLTY